MMFFNFAHFKKATKVMHEDTCNNGMKLSQYRDRFAQIMGFSNVQALKAYYDSRKTELQVVSVITYMNESIHSKYDFIDDEEGNKKAEELFKSFVKDYNSSYEDEDLESCVENGYFEDKNSDYQVFIVHSC